MKYGVISLVLCISTCLRLVTILSLLVKYLVIFHAYPCNKSYIYRDSRLNRPESANKSHLFNLEICLLSIPNVDEQLLVKCSVFTVSHWLPASYPLPQLPTAHKQSFIWQQLLLPEGSNFSLLLQKKLQTKRAASLTEL